MADDLYQKGLGEFNKIEAELSHVRLQREWSKIQGHWEGNPRMTRVDTAWAVHWL